MGKELEYKLQVADAAQLEALLQCREVAALVDEPWRTLAMQTTYYDNEARDFAQKHWTFRHRSEGGVGIACLKTPSGQARARNEWQVEADCLDEAAVAALIREGAPEELAELTQVSKLVALCGASFTRRCVMLRFSDGTRAELAGDLGELYGASERAPLCELEVELYEGSEETLHAFALLLCKNYGLHEQPMSKFARARELK